MRQDTGDDCPTCLFIRVRADRADQRGMIALSVDEVAELRARDPGEAATNHYLREPDKLSVEPSAPWSSWRPDGRHR